MNTDQDPLITPLRCIVKLGGALLPAKMKLRKLMMKALRLHYLMLYLGGAAITCKNEIEKINDESLETVSSQLRQAMISGSCSSKIVGMDWSKRDGNSEISLNLDDFGAQELLGFSNFIIVHGAGSFGHFQASKSQVHKGGLERSLVKAGFVATRISVTKLNLDIVRALAREGIPSIGMSPFACGWSTCGRKLISANVSGVANALSSGFVPGCTILSGDVIIRYLAEHMKPEYVVFLTDVLGVYDQPPTEPNAVLLREIAVKEDGTWSVVQPKLDQQVEITVAAHDTTGGMMTKINEAAVIAKLGIDVYIVKATTIHSVRAMRGELRGCQLPDDWLGTLVRYSRV